MIEQPIEAHIFLFLPTKEVAKPTPITTVITDAGIKKILRDPESFIIGMRDLKRFCRTPIDIVQIEDTCFFSSLWIKGHACYATRYADMEQATLIFQRWVEECLGLYSQIIYPLRQEIPQAA